MIEGPGYFIEKVGEPWNFRRKTKDAKVGALIQAGYSSRLKNIPDAWDYCNYFMIIQNPSDETLAFWIRNKLISIGGQDILNLKRPKTYNFKKGKQWAKDTEKVIIETIGKKPEEINVNVKNPKTLDYWLYDHSSIADVIKGIAIAPTYFMGAEFFGDDPEYRFHEISSLTNPSYSPPTILIDLFRIGSVKLTIEKNSVVSEALDDLGQHYITLMADSD